MNISDNKIERRKYIYIYASALLLPKSHIIVTNKKIK